MSGAFVFKPVQTFPGTAKITVPGIVQPQDLPVVWRVLSRQQQQAWIDRMAKRSDGDADADGLLEVMADWSLVDAESTSIPLTKKALMEVLAALPAAAGELVSQYIRQVNESRLGN